MGEEPFDEDVPEEPGESLSQPLSTEERDSVEADLVDLDSMRGVFEPQGAKGVVIACADCGENHYYGWELLQENLEHMLETGEPRMHEPAFDPKEDDYVAWDYAKGYVDALADAGLDPETRGRVDGCAWWGSTVEPAFGFCPRCGREPAPVPLYLVIVER